MFRFILSSLFLAQLVMSGFLRVENPEPGRWYEMGSFGVGGRVVVEMDSQQSSELELKLGNSQGDIIFHLVADEGITKISTSLSEEEVKTTSLSASGLKELVVEVQSEGVFVDLVGSGSVVLPYPADSWTGNRNKAWDSVDSITRVYVGGRGVKFIRLAAHVLVF